MASYPTPPWLNRQGTDPATAFVGAFRAGASVAIEKAQLAQQSERAAMAAAIKQQESEQQALRDQQKIAIDSAQFDAQVGLKQQSLDIAHERIVQSAKMAAVRFQVQEEYRRRVAAGEDSQKVLLELGPSMGIREGLTSLAKAPMELMVPGGAEEVPGLSTHVRVRQGPNSYGYIPKPKDPDLLPKPKDLNLVEMEKALAKARTDLLINKKSKAAEYIPKLEAAIAKIKGDSNPFAEGATIRSKKDGKLYRVVNGKPQPIE